MSFADRAGAAEHAVRKRHLRRVWALPGTVLGRSGWPSTVADRARGNWNYWWQAQLLDTLIDAQLREPSTGRLRIIERFVPSVRLRNFGAWTNEYYDDVAWFGLALQRIRRVSGSDVDGPISEILARLHEGWTADAGGGIWWRRGDAFKNAPANGPAAIMHARAGETEHAAGLTSWMRDTLVDPATGLVRDGLRVDTGVLVDLIFTYCQGVYLGACLELGRTDDAERTVRAVAEHCAPGGVIRGQGGGDGGLFAAILARYLTLAATALSGASAATARRIVLTSAEAAWSGAADAPGGPLFSADWSVPAPGPTELAGTPSRDLSVQVGGWMLLESAAALERA